MKSTMTLEKSIFLFDGHNGTFIPQFFAEEMLHPSCLYQFNTDSPSEQNSNRSYYLIREMLNELVQGQDNEFYWDNWNDLLCYYNEMRKMETNELFYLTQMEDGHLYLIHEDEIEQYDADCDSTLDYNAFTLTVDINERGMYRCHVENCVGDVIWECDTEYVQDLQNDGFIKYLPHEDIERLESYLKSIHVLGTNAKLKYIY
jgi:hypothetical protein